MLWREAEPGTRVCSRTPSAPRAPPCDVENLKHHQTAVEEASPTGGINSKLSVVDEISKVVNISFATQIFHDFAIGYAEIAKGHKTQGFSSEPAALLSEDDATKNDLDDAASAPYCRKLIVGGKVYEGGNTNHTWYAEPTGSLHGSRRWPRAAPN